MTKQSFWLICLLVLFVLLFGYNYTQKPFENLGKNITASQVEKESLEAEVIPVKTTVDEIMAAMSPRQKITQLLAVPLTIQESFADPSVATSSSQLQWIQQANPGSVVIFGSKVSTKAATVAIQEAHQPQLPVIESDFSLTPLVAVDHEGGTVQRLSGSGFTPLKSWAELCKLDPVSSQIELEQSAQELRSVGVDVILGPVLDVSAKNGALGSRVCSGESKLVNERARLATSVYQSHNIVPVFKHFPGIGKTSRDLHTAFDSVVVGEEDAKLYRDLLNFYQERPLGVMVAHVGVENQDPSLPCSMSSSCVSQLTTNFEGVLVYSDDVLMASAYQGMSQEDKTLYQVVLRALIAGNQQVLIGPGADAESLNDVVLLIEEAYTKNAFIQQVIDQSAARVVSFKLERNQLQ